MSEKRFTELPPEFNVWVDDKPSNPDAFHFPLEEKAKEAIQKTMAPYSPKQRADIARLLNEKLTREMATLEASKAEKREHLQALTELQEWCKQENFVLEKNDCSRLHLLKEAIANKRLFGNDGVVDATYVTAHFTHTFVVKHDWAMAFEHASGIEDLIKLPYEICCFEFRFSGKTFIAIACEDESLAQGVKFTLLVQCGSAWYCWSGEKKDDAVTVFAWKQIRAICIALDADVATHEVVRAPHKLNEKRLKNGREPLSDYHVVDLAKRHRVANPPEGHIGSKKRLHFRRGHWRHYEEMKVWVRWCLVGDPDLGFIHKSYTL